MTDEEIENAAREAVLKWERANTGLTDWREARYAFVAGFKAAFEALQREARRRD